MRAQIILTHHDDEDFHTVKFSLIQENEDEAPLLRELSTNLRAGDSSFRDFIKQTLRDATGSSNVNLDAFGSHATHAFIDRKLNLDETNPELTYIVSMNGEPENLNDLQRQIEDTLNQGIERYKNNFNAQKVTPEPVPPLVENTAGVSPTAKEQVMGDFSAKVEESFPPLNCQLSYDESKDVYFITFEGPNASKQLEVFTNHFLKGSYGSGLLDDEEQDEIKHVKTAFGTGQKLEIDSHDFPAVLARMTKVIKNASLDPATEASAIVNEEMQNSRQTRWGGRENALANHLTDLKNQLPDINKELEIAPSAAQKIFQGLTSLWNKISDWIVNFKELYRKGKGSEVALPSDEVSTSHASLNENDSPEDLEERSDPQP